MSQKEAQDLNDAFNQLDKDGSGTLTKEELMEGYRIIYGDNFDEADIDAMINMADENQDGSVSYGEWLMTAMDRGKLLTSDKLESLFQNLDVDHSNSISFDEIRNFLFGSRGFDEDYLRNIMHKYDSDQSGELSIDQFKNLMYDLLQ